MSYYVNLYLYSTILYLLFGHCPIVTMYKKLEIRYVVPQLFLSDHVWGHEDIYWLKKDTRHQRVYRQGHSSDC